MFPTRLDYSEWQSTGCIMYCDVSFAATMVCFKAAAFKVRNLILKRKGQQLKTLNRRMEK